MMLCQNYISLYMLADMLRFVLCRTTRQIGVPRS